MPRTPRLELPPLDAAHDQPLYRQVYQRLREAIAVGTLRPGDRIPSVRALTRELGLARGTIEAAYALLVAEGYVQPRGQAGTFVAPGLRLPGPQARPAAPPDPAPADPGGWYTQTLLPTQLGVPALDAFPRKSWARLAARCTRATQPADLINPPACGLPALRREIAAYLQVARGIACTPEQVFVTAGYRQTLDLMARTLLVPGSQVWHEDPGYPPTPDWLARAGHVPLPVPVDEQGLCVDAGIARAPDAAAAIVTPAHQSPTGVALSLPRRLALLAWAARQNAWILEDDYDGEFRYASRPLPALQGLDRNGRVLYAGTFTKVLFPGIRLAYLVVPHEQVGRFEAACRVFGGGQPGLTQAIVAAFMAEGHFVRHIQRMRRLYAERRRMAAAALAGALDGLAEVLLRPGGMHLVLRLSAHACDRELARTLRAEGLYAQALSDWAIQAPTDPALLVGFTNVDSAAMAASLGRHLREALARRSRTVAAAPLDGA
ncbi:MocR-like pyridoxine biosynthesis transcription factor PdxR [Bordetella sp. 2513F-2]